MKCKQKQKDMNIQTAKRPDLEIELLSNDELYNWVENKFGSVEDWAINATDEELREVISEFVISNNETFQF